MMVMLMFMVMTVMLIMENLLDKVEPNWNPGGHPTVELVWRPSIEFRLKTGKLDNEGSKNMTCESYMI